VPCPTAALPLHGGASYDRAIHPNQDWARVYGTDWPAVVALERADPRNAQRLHARLPHSRAAVIYAARHEMARTVEDVLSRRTRALLLDARAAMECAGDVAAILADDLKRTPSWQADQETSFAALARGYLPPLV
jgi:glycerol-3-phosphate dehydrogenase